MFFNYLFPDYLQIIRGTLYISFNNNQVLLIIIKGIKKLLLYFTNLFS